MKIPKITVLMSVYNNESFINEAIDSILNQTFSDFQFLIIDDGSTDNSVALIKQYDDSRINLVEKDNNTGLIDCLNLGMSLAKGQYIARMDSDDISTSDRFQKQLDILENNPEIDICGCWLQEFGKRDKVIKHKERHEEIVANMLWSCAMSMCSVLIDRKAIEGYKFDENKKHVEDYDFWSRIAWSCKFYNIQEVLYLYRIHEAQVSTVHKQVQIQGDIGIKLFLFKKIGYDTQKYPDELIAKLLLLNGPFKVNEFSIFINWINDLIRSNKYTKAFNQRALESVLSFLKEKTINKIYFSNTISGITKKWRLNALMALNIRDVFWVINIKRREILKTIWN